MEQMVSGVGVLDKSLGLVALVAERPRTLAELVTASGLSRATAHRLAVALEAHGLLRRAEDGRFALGLHLIALGRAAAEQYPLAETARASLAELRDTTGESVQLYVRDGADRVCIAALESPHGLRTIVPVGAALPMDVGSAGRVLSGEASRTGWRGRRRGQRVGSDRPARASARQAARRGRARGGRGDRVTPAGLRPGLSRLRRPRRRARPRPGRRTAPRS